MDNRFNKVFPSFDLLNKKYFPGSCLINIFPSYFSFYSFNKYSSNNLEDCSHQLDDIAIMSLLNYLYALVISNAGIKNNMAISIAYIHVYNKPIIKMIHHVVNVILTEAKLFAIRCNINQAINLAEISKIVVVTDSIHTTKRIFDSLIYSFQIYSASISKELRKFFLTNNDNSITFWKCPSWCDWPLFKLVDRDTKQFQQTPLFSCKLSWDFSKKSKYNNIIQNWKIIFQALDLKGCQFLELINNDNNPIKLSSSQIIDLVFLYFHSHFHSHFNSLFYFSIFRT